MRCRMLDFWQFCHFPAHLHSALLMLDPPHFPPGFLTAMRQEVTRAHKGWALDSVVLFNDVCKVFKEDITSAPSGTVAGEGVQCFIVVGLDVLVFLNALVLCFNVLVLRVLIFWFITHTHTHTHTLHRGRVRPRSLSRRCQLGQEDGQAGRAGS